MNLHHHPEQIDRLAAEYALGTLRGGARRRLEHLARTDEVVGQAVRHWQRRIAAMTELVPGVPPPESVWRAIEAQLGQALRRPAALTAPRPVSPSRAATRPLSAAGRWFDSLNFWRGWAAFATVAAVLVLGLAITGQWPAWVGTQHDHSGARIGYVAVLHDQASQSTMLVTWDDAHSTMTLRTLVSYPLRSDQTLQLWGLPSQGHPVSLGLIRGGAAYTVQLPERPQNYPVLAVSVEPSGGSTKPDGPTGPVVYSGKLVPTT